MNKKEALAKALTTYINEKHTQEECVGFIDGFNSGFNETNDSFVKKLTYYTIFAIVVAVLVYFL